MIRYIVFLAFVCMSSLAAQTPVADRATQERQGRELVAKLTAGAPDENSSFRGILRITSKKQKVTNEVPVICNVVKTNGGWETIYETIPNERTGKEKLVVRRSAGRP